MANQKDKGETTSLNVTMQEVYSQLCEECKKKVEALVKDKLTDEIIKKTLEGR